jgi:hypothetical protein
MRAHERTSVFAAVTAVALDPAVRGPCFNNNIRM